MDTKSTSSFGRRRTAERGALRLGAIALTLGAAALLFSSCATYSEDSTEWDAPYAAPAPEWMRDGQVAWIRETVHHVQGNPVGGAAAGAVIGGILGHAIGGEGLGTLMGAAGGALVGANASRGQSESRTYEVRVRFDDGGAESFYFQGAPPFRPGELVALTPEGLEARG